MDYHIFHSTQVEASRDLVAALGAEPLNTGMQILSVNGDSVTITGHHIQNVAINPNIPGYPYVTFKNGDQDVGLFAPASWDEVKAWVAPEAPVLAAAKPTVLSPYEFAIRFTQDERKAILAAMKTDVDVEDAKTVLDKASQVDLTNPVTVEYVELLVSKGLLTQDRAALILAP
ncbi:MAG: hypothetical protein HY795_05845 [Desulfovibrio sp.]|nr:hypothetical protein [Desulfovibrio sp.]MBI4961355.1 hypothetical protein [Desulfovibrio sp.]